MANRKRLLLIVFALTFWLISAGCDESSYSGPGAAYVTPTPRQPSARELAAVETAQAEETTAAMEEAARGTADALELERRATQQALDLEQAAANATAEAWWFSQTQEAVSVQSTATAEAKQATATRQALDETASAEAHQATSTAVQWAANVQGTQAAADAFAVEATRRAVARADEREQVTQPIRAWWAWALLALAVPALLWVGWRAAQVLEARGRVIRRQAGEGEPVIMLTRDRIAAPLRMFNALMSGDELPALPAPEYQEAATMRQQTANAIQARQAGQIAEAKSTRPKMLTQNVILPAEPQRKAHTRPQIPGLVRVVPAGSLQDAAAQGLLPPPLADSIEAEWSDVEGEE
ncbi:MAG: hypothetical protein JW918_00990 [Anaerolineae bacterium]|nr:hypothetical protein [Anaerolineae bacterium]